MVRIYAFPFQVSIFESYGILSSIHLVTVGILSSIHLVTVGILSSIHLVTVGILSSHPPRYSWNIIEHPPRYSWIIIELGSSLQRTPKRRKLSLKLVILLRTGSFLYHLCRKLVNVFVYFKPFPNNMKFTKVSGQIQR